MHINYHRQKFNFCEVNLSTVYLLILCITLNFIIQIKLLTPLDTILYLSNNTLIG